MNRNHRYLAIPLIVLPALLLLNSAAPGASSVGYEKRWARGMALHVVTIDLNDPAVRLSPVIPRYGIGHSETWGAMVSRARPTAAITGTFFNTRSMYPTGDIFIDGSLVCRGVTGTALCIGPNNQVSFIAMHRRQRLDWSQYQHVLVGGPLLLSAGKVVLSPKDQGFRDGRLFSKRPRTAVGLTRHNKLVMVAVTRPVYLGQLAKAMRAIGVTDAAALDGGGSTALYYRGKSIAKPSRRLTNILVAYSSAERYDHVKSLLAATAGALVKAP